MRIHKQLGLFPLVEAMENRQLLSVSFSGDSVAGASENVAVRATSNDAKSHARRASSQAGPVDIRGVHRGTFFIDRSIGVGKPARVAVQLKVADEAVGGGFTGTFGIRRVGTFDTTGIITGNRLSFSMLGPGSGTFTGRVNRTGRLMRGQLFADLDGTFTTGTVQLKKRLAADRRAALDVNRVTTATSNIRDFGPGAGLFGPGADALFDRRLSAGAILTAPSSAFANTNLLGLGFTNNALGINSFSPPFSTGAPAVAFDALNTGFGTRRIHTSLGTTGVGSTRRTADFGVAIHDGFSTLPIVQDVMTGSTTRAAF
jgi:hypothetical protein